MNNNLSAGLVQELVPMARNWGLSEGSAAIYAVLASTGNLLTMTELQELTGYSLSSVSTHLKSLTDKYLVLRTKKEGVYVYRAETNFEEIFKLLARELLYRNILPLYQKVEEFRKTQATLHLSLLEEEMEKFIDYLTRITEIKGETHALKKDKVSMSSVP